MKRTELFDSAEMKAKKDICYNYLKQIEEGTMSPWEARWCLEDMQGLRYTVSKEITTLATNCIYKLLSYAKDKKYIEENIDFDTFCNRGIVLLIKQAK